MDRGYLKLWRKSIDSDVFQNPELWRVWTWCLMKTTYKKRNVPFKTGKGKLSVSLDSGQFLFGRNSAAEALGDSPSTVWKRIKKLESLGCISVESNRQYSVVTVCNWVSYQPDEEVKVTSREQPSDKQVTTEEQASDTNKKLKKDKKEKKTTLNGVPYSEIVSYFNEQSGKSFKSTSKATRQHINARWNEGFTFDEFKTVIDSKVNEWMGDVEMAQYIRPQTIFGPKFESYLQAAKEDQPTTRKSRYTPHEIPNV